MRCLTFLATLNHAKQTIIANNSSRGTVALAGDDAYDADDA